MNPLQSFLTNAPVRDVFNPFTPRKDRAPDLSDLTPKARNSWQQNKPLEPVHTLEDDKEVFLYQKDRFVFQPSKSLTQQWGNLPEGPLVNPSFPNHPTETFLRPPEGLSLTGKQRALRNYKKEPGLFDLIPGDLPPPVPKEFISMDTVTERSIKDQRYSDGVPRQGVAMDMATELHRNQGLTQGLGELLQQFQNMPGNIAAQLAPLIPKQPATQYLVNPGDPSELSFGGGLSGLFGSDIKSIDKIAENVSINSAKNRIMELQGMDMTNFKKNAREVAKKLGATINLRGDSKNETINNLQERLKLIERIKEDRQKQEQELKEQEGQSPSASRRSSLASVDEKETERIENLNKARLEAATRDFVNDYKLYTDKTVQLAPEKLNDLRNLAKEILLNPSDPLVATSSIREKEINEMDQGKLLVSIDYRLRQKGINIKGLTPTTKPPSTPSSPEAKFDDADIDKVIKLVKENKADKSYKKIAKMIGKDEQYVIDTLSMQGGDAEIIRELGDMKTGAPSTVSTAMQALLDFYASSVTAPITEISSQEYKTNIGSYLNKLSDPEIINKLTGKEVKDELQKFKTNFAKPGSYSGDGAKNWFRAELLLRSRLEQIERHKDNKKISKVLDVQRIENIKTGNAKYLQARSTDLESTESERKAKTGRF